MCFFAALGLTAAGCAAGETSIDDPTAAAGDGACLADCDDAGDLTPPSAEPSDGDSCADVEVTFISRRRPHQIELVGAACDAVKSGDHEVAGKFSWPAFVALPR